MQDKTFCTRRDFIKAITASAALPFLNGNPELTKSQKRSIIFILSDDHRFDFFSFMGKPKFLRTPNLDRLALDGAYFRNAFVSNSLCSPSRATILTGMHSYKHGVVDNDSPAPAENTFFNTYLKQAGYRTAYVGKWHMGEHSHKPQPGFDRWVSFPGQGVYFNPELHVDGERVERKGYITDLLTEYSVEWIKQQDSNPFFLYLSHKAVHSEFEPAPRHAGIYKDAAIEYPASMADTKENYRNKPRWVREQRFGWHGVDYMYHGAMNFDTLYRRYCETLLAVDESVGAILNALKEKGLLESTLIVYASDNGFSLGEHGLIDKRQMYEESMRIPLLVHCPDLIRPKTRIDQFVQNVDIAPTFLEAAALNIPKAMDGKSFLDLLQGKQLTWRDSVFYTYYWERPFPHTPTVFGIRTARYKYITYHGIWDLDELYDLQNDPHEMENLIDRKEHQDLIQSLRNRVYDWLAQNNAMQIPLRKPPLWQAAERKPHQEI